MLHLGSKDKFNFLFIQRAILILTLTTTSLSVFAGGVTAGGGGSFCAVLIPADEKAKCDKKFNALSKTQKSQFRRKAKTGVDNYRRTFAFMGKLALRRLKLLLEVAPAEIADTIHEHVAQSSAKDLGAIEDLIETYLQDSLFKNSDHKFDINSQLVDDQNEPLTAMNRRHADFTDIVLNPFFWEAAPYLFPQDPTGLLAKQVIALHEFLSLFGIEKTDNYVVSSLLIQETQNIEEQLSGVDEASYTQMIQIAALEVLCLADICYSKISPNKTLRDLSKGLIRIDPRKLYFHMARSSSFPLPFFADFKKELSLLTKNRGIFFSPRELSFAEVGAAMARAKEHPSRLANQVMERLKKLEEEKDLVCRFKRLSIAESKDFPRSKRLLKLRYSCLDRENFKRSHWQISFKEETSVDYVFHSTMPMRRF